MIERRQKPRDYPPKLDWEWAYAKIEGLKTMVNNIALRKAPHDKPHYTHQ